MNKISDAYSKVHASEELIDSTQKRLAEIREKKEQKSPFFSGRRLGTIASACAAIMMVLVLCGYNLTASAASYISIDAKPSIELTLNKLDNVIDAKAYNKSGQEVLDGLDLKGMNYDDAVDCILNSDVMKSYTETDPTISLSVISKDKSKSTTLKEGIESCHAVAENNAKASVADSETYHEAHDHGLSFGKYSAYLDASETDDSITPEECHDMSMDEIGHHGEGECDEESGEGSESNHHDDKGHSCD